MNLINLLKENYTDIEILKIQVYLKENKITHKDLFLKLINNFIKTDLKELCDKEKRC